MTESTFKACTCGVTIERTGRDFPHLFNFITVMRIPSLANPLVRASSSKNTSYLSISST